MMPQFVGMFASIRIVIIHFIGAQNDMLMWLMSEARGVERSLEGLARRLLQINVASVNSMSLVRGITVTARRVWFPTHWHNTLT
jgi:hypothetical protein